MMLRIERTTDHGNTVLQLIGRIRSEHLGELKAQIGSTESGVVLDMENVTLVDVDVVRFLWACEAEGVEVVNCSPYIREWMRREQDHAR